MPAAGFADTPIFSRRRKWAYVRDLLRWHAFSCLEKARGFPRERQLFRQVTGRELDLDGLPQVADKLVWKKLHDRNPLLPLVADKYRMRRYVQAVLGREAAEAFLVPLRHATDDPSTIPFDALADAYIIRVNHASRRNIMVRDPRRANRSQIVAQCRSWLNRPYGLKLHEWAYQPIERKVVVETLLLDDDGNLPSDYKFYVIHGKCRLIMAVYGRHTKTHYGYYLPDWEPVEVEGQHGLLASRQARPERLDEMLRMGEALGKHFDFIRVDCYLVQGRIYVGELTNYPEAGYINWQPKDARIRLGAHWNLEPGYWRHDAHIRMLDLSGN